jgi:cysteine synthase
MRMSDYHKNYADQCDARVKELSEKLETAVEALSFYRNEYNWIAHGFETCSPIIADTGKRAKEAIEKINER